MGLGNISATLSDIRSAAVLRKDLVLACHLCSAEAVCISKHHRGVCYTGNHSSHSSSPPESADLATLLTMAIGFFKNYRVYMLTTVAYMGSLLFGMSLAPLSSVDFLTTLTPVSHYRIRHRCCELCSLVEELQN